MSRPGRAELRREFEAVRQVLSEDWNPVGVYGLPADEYDDYVWPILALLRENAQEEALLARLREIELRWFSQTANEARLLTVVARLQGLRIANRGSPK